MIPLIHEATARSLSTIRGRKRFALYDRIRDSLYQPRNEIEARAIASLRGILVHAYETTRAYRLLMDDAGINPREITRLADIRLLGITEKAAIRDNPNDYFSSAARREKCQKKSTSGSSGTPLTFYRDPEYVEWGHAGTMRNMAIAGWSPGAAIGLIWGYEKNVSRKRDLWKAGLTREFYLNAFSQTPQAMDQWTKAIRANEIHFLYGYPSSVSEFARHVLQRDYDLPMKAVFLTAEMYFPGEREIVERAFQCRSYNLYGSSEVQNIAFECTRGRLHIASDFTHVEERLGTGSNAPELITTSFLNTCMPFIRYALGDHGRVLPDACECGIHTPLLELLGGSKYDFLEGPDGIVHGAVLERIFQKIEDVRRYQIVQHSLESYTVRVEIQAGADCGTVMTRVREAAHQILGGLMRREVSIQFENPARIASGPAGKFRFIYRQPAGATSGTS